MNSNIQAFNYQGNREVRVIEQDGEPWFVAKDVCEILELGNITNAIKSLDDDEKMTLNLSKGHSGERGGAQFMNIINEPGLYKLIFKSRKSEAKQFTRWVTHEVLPDIRKHGMYLNEKAREAALVDPEAFNTVVKAYALNAGYLVLGKLIAPLAGYVPVADGAQIIRQKWGDKVDIGRNKLFKYGRERNYLSKQKGRWNKPTQKGIDAGFASVDLDHEIFKEGKFGTRTMISVKALETIGRDLFATMFPLLAPLLDDEEREAV